jgi:hypothetical protein
LVMLIKKNFVSLGYKLVRLNGNKTTKKRNLL